MDVRARASTLSKLLNASLRAKVAVGVALPVLIMLTLLSLVQYWHSNQMVEQQIRLTAIRLGDVVSGSLRHTMLSNNQVMLAQSLVDISAMDNILQVQIINRDGRVSASSRRETVGTVLQKDEPECMVCHQFPPESRPRSTDYTILADVLRISNPISNEPECFPCHDQANTYLGVLLTDVSMGDVETQLRHALQIDLIFSVGITLVVSLITYSLTHTLVVRRIEAFRGPLRNLTGGNFSARLPVPAHPTDEIDRLGTAYNRLATELEHRAHEREVLDKLREQAMAEERGRIARELHDGLAQLLGYVNTKAMAVRLMLKNGQLDSANQTLLQLEEAARELFVDVREAIADLKLEKQHPDANLATRITDAADQFRRLSGFPVQLKFAPTIENLSLPAETQQQLVRIVQESLTNIHKHARASTACVTLKIEDNNLELMIGDDGRGFDPYHLWSQDQTHFGLTTMRERTEAIGAALRVDTRPGAGTQISVHLPLEEA